MAVVLFCFMDWLELKELNKKKKKKEEEKKKGSAVTEQNGKKRERKVYELPGQKRDPPEEVVFVCRYILSLCFFIWYS